MNSHILKQAQQLISENSAALLTGTGVIGVVTTAVLTGRATIKAQQVIQDASVAVIETETSKEVVDVQLDTVDKIKLVWPHFIPPMAAGVTTISAIVFSYRISASKSAALAAAYGISEKAFREYKDKVIENVTPKKADDIQDAVDQQKMKDNPPPTAQAMIVGDGEQLILDSFSGRYFKSTIENCRKAANDINADIGHHNVASLGDFYEKVGLKQTDISEQFCWNIHNFCEVDFTAQLTDDGRSCLVLSFINPPRPSFDPNHREYIG